MTRGRWAVRAYVQHAFGGPEAMSFADIDPPTPAADEVLVAVSACALNRLDLLQREAPLVRGFALPHIAGMDVAGTVVARGDGLADGVGPAVGTEVIADPVSTCGVCERCTRGQAPYCEWLRTLGSTRPGGFAEYVAVPAASCFERPAGMSAVTASTLPVAAMTAWQALHVVGRVQSGESVLVNGAGAGVSIAVMQQAHAAGARVIATAGGPAKVAKALAAGYDACIDYRSDDLVAAVRDFTDGRGADLVIDHVGPALFAPSIDAMAIEGRMVFCGTTTGTETTLPLTSVYWWGRSLLGAGGYQRSEFPVMLAGMADVYADASVTPVIHTVWPFDDVPAALAQLEAGDFFGKIVVTFN